PGQLVEVPPGYAVHGRHHGGLRPEQGLHGGGNAGQRVGLERHDHIVLRTRFLRLARGLGVGNEFLAFGPQLQAIGLNGCQMRPTCDQRDLLAGQRQVSPQQTADSAGAVDADLHVVNPSLAARPMRCSLPVAPFGISATNTTLRGTLKSARWLETKSRSSRSVALRPSRKTIAAATSSPSLSWGSAKVTHWATAGWVMRRSSTSRGEIFSPPRLISSFNRPVMVR